MRRNKTIMLTATVCFVCACVEQKHTSAEIDLSRHEVGASQVEVMTLQRTSFPRELLSNGKLKAAGRATLSFRSTGTISSIQVRNGQRVSKGTVLAVLDRPDLNLSFELAEIALEKAEIELYDYLAGRGFPAQDTTTVPKTLLQAAKIRTGYSSAILALRQAKFNLDNTVLRAPFSGRIADLIEKPFGQSETGPICTLPDDSRFDVDFTVMESEWPLLKIGLPVRVTPFAQENVSFSGVVTEINPSVGKNGQIQVRARVNNDGTLIDGMNVNVIIELIIPDQLVVPRSAVVIRDNLDVLFTYTDDGMAHWTYVDILFSNGNSHAVEAKRGRNSTLREGDRIIISGNLNLADMSVVTLKP